MVQTPRTSGVFNLGALSADNAFEAPSLDLNFDGTASSYTRATTSPTAAKANGDQLATSIVTQNKGGTVQSKYLGPNGKLINGFVQNHVDHSTDFSQWTVSNGQLTTGQADPFGGTAASTFTDSNNNNTGNFYANAAITPPSSVTSNTWSASLFVKKEAAAANNGLLRLNVNNSTDRFDLQFNPHTGAYQAFNTASSPSSTSSFSANREDFGDWWRYSVSCVLATADYIQNNLSIFPSANTGTFSSTPAPYSSSYTGSITIFGAQLETTATPSQYVPSTVSPTSAQVPRLEFDASGNPLGLLVEESRTNYIGDSSDFGASAWNKQAGLSLAADTSISDPTGGSGAWKLGEGNSGTTQFTLDYAAYTPSAGQTTVFSVFARPISGANNELVLTQWGEGYVSFNLNNGTVAYASGGTDETGEIIPVGNGWYRCILTTVETNSTASFYYIIPGAGTFTSGSHIFTHGAADVCHIFGAQVEVGEGATSYIPTSGGTTATRAADDITLATSSFGYNTAAGTTVADFTMQGDTNTGYPGIFTFIDAAGTGASPRDILYLDSASDDLNMFSNESSTDTVWTLEAGVSFPLVRSVAVRLDGTSGQDAIDGTLSASQTLGVAPSTPRATLHVGSNGSTNPMNGHIRRFIYWPRALSDASLASYTGTNPPTIDLDRPTRRWGGMTGRSLVSLVDSTEHWTPADITSANVVGWFDGENVNGGTSGNSGATVWVNKAGGANLNFNGSPSPAVGTNNVRTASSAYLSEAGTPSFLQTSDWRVFIAATINGGSGSDQYSPLFSSDTGSTNTGAFIYWKTTAQEFASYPNNTTVGTSTWWGFIDPIAPTYRSNFQSNPAVIDFKVSANSPWEIAFDGGRSVSVVSQTITTQIPSNEAAHFGYSYTATRRHDASYYQIVIVHGTLSGDDEARLYSYLAHKAGSQSYLQTSAYSSAAPKRVVPGVPTTGVLSLAEHYQVKL